MAEFGHFEILGVLGSGGMGKVYRAKNNEKDRTVALKLMQREMLQAPDFRARFDKEAKINSSLKHPNIVEVFDHGIINNRPFIEMELLPNGSLHDLFHVPNVFRLSRASELLKGVAAGLDYAHGRGIIHRDIKLGNVLLAEDNVPKLVDFGLARAVFETHMTRTSAMLGTPLYMSPEQAISARDIDFRADIYSLAVMAYLLATGHFPFYDDKLLVVLNQHVQMMPPLPTEVNPALPKAMDGVLLKGLAKNPDDRYQTASELMAAYGAAANRAQDTTTLIKTKSYNPGTLNVVQDGTATPFYGRTPSSPASRSSTTQTKVNPGRRSGVVGGVVAVALLAVVSLVGIAAFGVNGGRGDSLPTLAPTDVPVVLALEVTTEPDPTEVPEDNRPTLPPTFTPTFTPEPPTETAVPEEVADAIVEVSDAYLYDFPDDQEPPTTLLGIGTPLQVFARNTEADWLQVSDGNTVGWIPVVDLTLNIDPASERVIDIEVEDEFDDFDDVFPPPPGGPGGPGGPGFPPGEPVIAPLPGGRDWASEPCDPYEDLYSAEIAISVQDLELWLYLREIGDWTLSGTLPAQTTAIVQDGPVCKDGDALWRLVDLNGRTLGWVPDRNSASREPVLIPTS